MTLRAAALALIIAAGPLAAAEAIVAPPEPGSVSAADGLAAFDRVFAVVSHPRCANCHTGADNRPMWSGPEYPAPGPHGMAVDAGEDRIGAMTLPCSACHVTGRGFGGQGGAAPFAAIEWRLAPVEMAWFGKTRAEVCAQLKDPEANGGRDWIGLAEHLRDDAAHGGFVAWGFAPGEGRAPAPGDVQSHIDDVLKWGAAGQPCPPG